MFKKLLPVLSMSLLLSLPAQAEILSYPAGYSNAQPLAPIAQDIPLPAAASSVATTVAPSVMPASAVSSAPKIQPVAITAQVPSATTPVTVSTTTAQTVRQIDEAASYTYKAKQPSRSSSLLKDYSNELGARYWYSNGSINYNVENPRISRLEYEANSGHSLEIYTRLGGSSSNFLFKGLAGLGISGSGNVKDFDYDLPDSATDVPGTDFSSTDSKLEVGNFGYAILDLGYKLNFISGKRARTNLLVGYGYFKDNMTYNGATCIDTSSGVYAGCSAGEVAVPYDTKVLKNEAQWNMLRIGAETILKPSPNLTVRLEAAGVPYAAFDDDDSHYLRQESLGSVPNFRDSGNGYGMQLEAFVEYQLSKRWGLGVGGRYWRLWADETDTQVGDGGRGTSYDWDHERYGFLAEAKYFF